MSRNRKAMMASAITFVLSSGPPAIADTELQEAHRSADRDGNGLVDLREFHDRMVDVFFLKDADRNGRLEPAELPAANAELLRSADRNGDGSLALEEFLAARAIDFEAADQNADGGLSVEEAARYR